jgi:3-phosphoshikimate 1-carboxyvinyltransferase
VSSLHVAPRGPLLGRVRVPGDKSISHRALIFNALAEGTARVEGLLDALDVRSTRRCLEQMGVRIADLPDGSVRIEGTSGALEEPLGVLDCGNSGTSMRLLCGLLAGQDFHAVLTGDEHLVRRPMARVTAPLRRFGASFEGRERGRYPPLSVRGGVLKNLAYESPIASAQVKTALLLAALQGEGRLVFREPQASRDHSERMLRSMGVELLDQDGALVLDGPQVPRARDVVVPGDISSAAFFLVAASITPGSDLVVENVGLNPTRAGVLDALLAMGADIQLLEPREASGEPVADLRVRHAPLRGARIEGALIPRLIDEVPVLAVAAACAEGPTRIADAAELRVKESDRISATVAMLAALGVDCAELPDGLVVQPSPLRAGRVDALGDHRIAMSGAVAGCLVPVQVDDADNVATSFPSFMTLLQEARS